MRFKSIKHNVERFLEFIHIPKNAGTTIENVAKESNIKWGIYNMTQHTITSSDLDDDVRNLIKHIYKRDFDELEKLN